MLSSILVFYYSIIVSGGDRGGRMEGRMEGQVRCKVIRCALGFWKAVVLLDSGFDENWFVVCI